MTMGRRSTFVVAAIAAGLLVVAGCGASDGASSSIDTDQVSGAPPMTAQIGPPPESGDVVPVTAVDAEIVGEPCPADVAVDMSATEASVLLDETSRLEPMLGIVLQYGQQHFDVFGGYGLHWLSAGDASVFVSFTDDVAEHRAVLVERVKFPDELIVCQAPASEADQRAIQATLTNELAGRFTSIGAGGKSGAVTVGLNANEEALAEELVQRYGAAVEVTVGALTYPLAEAEAVCEARLEPSYIDGLAITIVESEMPVHLTSSATVPLTVRLTNTSDQTIRFDSGQPRAVITDAQGMPRTVDTRGVADVGVLIELEPGGHQDFDLDVSLASCDPALGYTLPSGEHHTVISLYNAQRQTEMHSEPLLITIAD